MPSFLMPEPMLYHSSETGFSLFGRDHLILLVLSLTLASSLVMWYRGLPAGTGGTPSRDRQSLLIHASGLALAILLVKDSVYLALGQFEPLFWPLHICNLCEFAAFAYALNPASRLGQRMGDLLFCWGPSGCTAALVFPGWSPYCPAWSIASLCGFVEHALVLGCALCLVLGGDYRPRPQHAPFLLGVTVACGLVFRLVNPLWNTNFFFVTSPSAAGLPGAWLESLFGNPGFLVAYLGFAFLLWCATYGIWFVGQSSRKAS